MCYYSEMPFAAAQVLVEVPYLLAQAVLFSAISYPMVHFEATLVSACISAHRVSVRGMERLRGPRRIPVPGCSFTEQFGRCQARAECAAVRSGC